MGYVIVGLLLFAGAALFGDKGYTWLVALTGALAVCYGVCIIVLRSRRKGGAGPLSPPDEAGPAPRPRVGRSRSPGAEIEAGSGDPAPLAPVVRGRQRGAGL